MAPHICPRCGTSLEPVPPALVPKMQASLAARAALLGITAHALTDDRNMPCVALSRGAWCEVLALRQAEQLLTALEAAMGRASFKGAP